MNGSRETYSENVYLHRALEFIVRSIEEQATLEGEPLSDEQNFLLTNLPTSPSYSVDNTSTVPFVSPSLMPRDRDYERLIALAKKARRRSIGSGYPRQDSQWIFAAAVCKLNHHPMFWLLQWAGVKDPRARWDRLLLVISALLIVSIVTLSVLVEIWTRSLWAWVCLGVGFLVGAVLLYVGSRHLEERQLKRIIEKSRE